MNDKSPKTSSQEPSESKLDIGILFNELVAKKKKARLSAADAVEVTLRQLRRDAQSGSLDKEDVEKWIASNAEQIAQRRMNR